MKIHIEWKEQYICMKGDYFMADFVAGAACSRRDPDPFPKDPVVGMAYVPFQQYGTIYQPEMGFDNGTIFSDLNKPFYGSRGEPR